MFNYLHLCFQGKKYATFITAKVANILKIALGNKKVASRIRIFKYLLAT